MAQEPVVPILVMVMNQDVKFTYECAVMAMSALSRLPAFARMMIGWWLMWMMMRLGLLSL